ncbi:GntR family transcriptional regulator [Flexivirga endophytica]|uniref:GntR family transcriptional regulator n=1 Tax=Flexivirga endophytica TaxID=1849103 RepID=A0A916WPG4_9MICO|nr:GntR family transcriptional regulator [Flexivirga endophytica]GGB17341.1 GntR family transcriptional regulator [Flexivirga endophytica]GHB38262.1 GntR family transcriptional regulator [Flexivirga endophytica]
MTAQTSLTSRLADEIVDLIVDGGLRPGDALESSRALAQRFEVTTPTVREALRRLEATDVVQFRHGSGTYVGAGFERRMVVNQHAGRDSIEELIATRLLLEPSIAAEAARCRTDVDLEVLEGALTNALTPQRGDERPALHFHVAVAAATGNRLVAETLEALLHLRSREQVQIRHRYDDRERDHAEHEQILEAIRVGDADRASELTSSHLQSIRDVLVDGSAGKGAK